MSIRLLGKDPDSPNGGSPTLWEDTETRDIFVQGWEVHDPGVLAQLGDVPAGESIVRIPHRMTQFLDQ